MAEQNRINFKLKELLEGYKINLKETKFEDEVYKWEAIEHFQKHWDIEADDFAGMFNKAFQKRENLFYQNSWGYISKAVKHFPEEVRRMFADLYDEDKGLEERIEDFQGRAIELLPMVKKATGKSRLNHQQDERTISIFLTFRFPEKYFLYMDSFYREFCSIIGEPVAAAGEKYIHYLELAESLKNDIVLKDEELLSLHRSILPDFGWDDKNLIVQNILYVMTNKEKGGNTRFLVANLTWNSKDWKEPTDDESSHKYVKEGGIPQESWNFDFENTRNTEKKVYGFAQFTNQPKLSGKNNLVIHHSKNKFVGFYGKAELFGEMRELGYNDKLGLTEITNMAGDRSLSVCLDNKIDNVKEKGYLEQKKRIGMVGFTYLQKVDTVNLILDEAIRLNPDQEKILSDIKFWLNDIKNDTDVKDMKNCPLNQIVYGPPGTGKTYNTINLALHIVDPAFYEEHSEDREKLRVRFNELLISDWENPQKGRISFCTFHQSFSYEDFVEGIKPVISKEDDDKEVEEGRIRYEIHDGLFKRMADRARYFSSGAAERDKQTFRLTEKQFDAALFFKLSLGDIGIPEDQVIYEHCVENNCISIGFMRANNMEGVPVKEIYRIADEKNLGSYHAQAMSHFKDYLKKGDYVLISKGKQKVRAIGRVAGDYFYDEESPIRHRHFRPVEWIVKDAEIPVEEVYEKNLSQQTIYSLNKKWIKKEFFIPGRENKTDKLKDENFVLIIDEINRGNVSQIFGELITLIEEDKRAGMEEALEVTLPYSKHKFSVPSNLYIIGTMNTADRSVEALDTALRRRFSFLEMMPDADLIASHGKTGNDDGMVGGINLVELLETINERLSYLLDEDHQIGHSFFMNVSDLDGLKVVFRDNIVPLLKEFFYNDFGKVRLVLGDKFVKKIDAGEAKPEFAADDDDGYILDKTVYRVIEIDKGFDIIDALKGVTLF